MSNAVDAKQDAMDLAESSRQTEWNHPSLVAEIFAGRFKPELIVPYPDQDPEDKKIGDAFIEKFESFLKDKVDADAIDRTREMPESVVQGLKDMGAFGMKISKEYGGLGLSQTNYCRTLQVGGGHCGSTVAWLSAHQSIGAPQPLKLFGTEAQKKTFLPRLTKSVSAFALTEPGVGSDPAMMSTEAKLSEDGKHWILNGRKLWCTNGAVADIIIVMARTPDKIVDGKPRKQISAFLVEKTMPGFKVIHRCDFMGLKGIQNALIEFDNVKVPKENLVGEIGKGLKLALTTLNAGRLSLPAACVGIGKKCVSILREWTKERVQWGTKIGNHEEIAAKTALAASGTFAMEAMTYAICSSVDRGNADIRLEAAMAKLFCTELSWKIAYETIQVRGGRGYETADSLKARGEKGIPLERMLRDMRINTILEGSTEVMHLFIAREALDMHMRIAFPLLNPKTPLPKKISTFFKCAVFYAKWYPQMWIPTGYVGFSHMGRALGSHFRFIQRNSRKLARNVFHMMLRHGPNLERRQLVLARLVEIGTELYAMTAVCAKAHTMKLKNPSSKGPEELADIFCKDARRRIGSHFKGLCCNQDRKMAQLSKAVMNGDFSWLEEGTIGDNV